MFFSAVPLNLLRVTSLMCHAVQIVPGAGSYIRQRAPCQAALSLTFVPRPCTEAFTSHTCHLQDPLRNGIDTAAAETYTSGPTLTHALCCRSWGDPPTPTPTPQRIYHQNLYFYNLFPAAS